MAVPRETVQRKVVRDDGSVPFTAPQTGAYPTADDHLTTKAYVDDAVGGGGGGGAPATAEFIVAAANAGLSAERVVTATPTIAWDNATPGQAKANLADMGAGGLWGSLTGGSSQALTKAVLPAGSVKAGDVLPLYDADTGELKGVTVADLADFLGL